MSEKESMMKGMTGHGAYMLIRMSVSEPHEIEELMQAWLDANMNRDEVEMKVCAAIEIAENSRAKVAPPIQHPDDAAIDKFALAMKQKMQKKRNEGRSKWDNKKEIPALQLQCLLFESTQKGDPIDVANYAMMLWHRDELTTPDTTG